MDWTATAETVVESVNIIFAWPYLSDAIIWFVGFLIGGIFLKLLIGLITKHN